jgi:uncharacterized membrane protein YedE/YeeE
MKVLVTSFLSGLVFALGLGISGMTRPIKVIGFLDFFCAWDLSPAFVMISAIGVYFVAYRWVPNMPQPLFAPNFALPKSTDLDPRLIGGAVLFGVGWGLGGFCPGPALTSLAAGAPPVLVFVAAMMLGMYAHRVVGSLLITRAEWRISSAPTSIQDA